MDMGRRVVRVGRTVAVGLLLWAASAGISGLSAQVIQPTADDLTGMDQRIQAEMK